ncbi:MAG TPA: DUF5996 family protein [Bryobacteraceae bacterium]|nr:DUF5996 family protein [Bryobacteraceae bacterium]
MPSLGWPPLLYSEWESTRDTLHMWTQIVGKTRMALTPLENHWWNVALYVTPRGLTTSPIPWRDETFEIQFDFIAHRLLIDTSAGQNASMRLFPRSVADFYAEYTAMLASLGIEARIYRKPVEFDDTTPFDQDRHHASYDAPYVERFQRILVNSDLVFKQFRSRFLGKCSPVHFFWGSFDLAVTRFSGRRASPREGADPITYEAYSHEVTSCGFWPGDRRYEQAAFYAYSAPAPPGLERELVRPSAAHWDVSLNEFILNYQDARAAPSPGDAILDFCQSAYEAGANLAQWDRGNLERGKGSL